MWDAWHPAWHESCLEATKICEQTFVGLVGGCELASRPATQLCVYPSEISVLWPHDLLSTTLSSVGVTPPRGDCPQVGRNATNKHSFCGCLPHLGRHAPHRGALPLSHLASGTVPHGVRRAATLGPSAHGAMPPRGHRPPTGAISPRQTNVCLARSLHGLAPPHPSGDILFVLVQFTYPQNSFRFPQ